jgi:2-phosphosulfolactate phosphatase
MFDDQSAYQERFDWGEAGLRRLAPVSDAVVVVDVLSFVTAVDIAVGRGATVFPYPERGAEAVAYAEDRGAFVGEDRGSNVADTAYSLSPSSLLTIPPGTRLVLPSPNGATLLHLAAELNSNVLAGCLRNAAATAAACRPIEGNVSIIAAGERWRDSGNATGSLRPALEDLIGAGAILDALSLARPSPEALAAIAAYRAASDLGQWLRECASGRELIERGRAADVALAAQANVSRQVLRLRDGAFTPQRPS